MITETDYYKNVSNQHIKEFGQYFTHNTIADFMCSWACSNANTVLDPAVGNGTFFSSAKKHNPNCSLTGYEIDKNILNYFGNPNGANIINKNYLTDSWDDKYDAIVCNPPYNRFQAIKNREAIIKSIYRQTNIKYSGFTNLYALFLIKSIFQMSDKGRLAYIIPSEFLNSEYGVAIKELLVNNKLLRAIINFKNNNGLFFNAITTCCIVLLDKEDKAFAEFYNISSIDELSNITIGADYPNSLRIDFSALDPNKKWRPFINLEFDDEYSNLTSISQFCHISRGIATGANDFFCLSAQKVKEIGIPYECLSKCICKSSDVKTIFLKDDDIKKLSDAGKNVYLLDVGEIDAHLVKNYLNKGIEEGIDKKYLTSHRTPWFSVERKKVAPILVTSACRNSIKFVRNIAKVKSLTTFHSVFMNQGYEKYTNLIFCYFLTPVAQKIIFNNRKELGNGLNKFQPNDLNNAKMLDINIISNNDKQRVEEIYSEMLINATDAHIAQLNSLFLSYL